MFGMVVDGFGCWVRPQNLCRELPAPTWQLCVYVSPVVSRCFLVWADDPVKAWGA